LTHALLAEPYSSVQVRMGALQAALHSVNRVMCALASCRTAQRRDAGRGRVGTTITRGYLQIWAMHWADWAPRWGSLQVPRWYSRPDQSWWWSGRAWARRLNPSR